MPVHEGDTELLENWRLGESSTGTDFDSEAIREENIHALPSALPTAPNKTWAAEIEEWKKQGKIVLFIVELMRLYKMQTLLTRSGQYVAKPV